MIGRFLTLAVLLLVGIGLILHFNVVIPGMPPSVGHLPGDLILRRGDVMIYLPFTTALIASGSLCFLGCLITGKS